MGPIRVRRYGAIARTRFEDRGRHLLADRDAVRFLATLRQQTQGRLVVASIAACCAGTSFSNAVRVAAKTAASSDAPDGAMTLTREESG
jgi:hypothetical protein